MPMDWTETRANVEMLLPQADDPTLRETAVWFAQVASILPAPCDVGLGYWRNSVRFSWTDREVEVFERSLEIYRFDLVGADIKTISFQPGDMLPLEVASMLEAGWRN